MLIREDLLDSKGAAEPWGGWDSPPRKSRSCLYCCSLVRALLQERYFNLLLGRGALLAGRCCELAHPFLLAPPALLAGCWHLWRNRNSGLLALLPTFSRQIFYYKGPPPHHYKPAQVTETAVQNPLHIWNSLNREIKNQMRPETEIFPHSNKMEIMVDAPLQWWSVRKHALFMLIL